jgi:hypothetical protein
MASSSEASATMDALELVLQSKVTFVVPAVTPRMKEPATVPVPAETVTLHGALVTLGRDAAPDAVAPERTVRPLTPSRAVAANTPMALIGRRRKLRLRLVEFFIASTSSSRNA